MIKLKFPRPRQAAGTELPPRLRWDAPSVSAAVLVSRREFLKALAVMLAATAAPMTGARRAVAAARGRFFTRSEFATLEALCDRIIPADGEPGAKAFGAPVYIDRMLGAFDRGRMARIFAGGPFSGRAPFPNNDDGTPSRRRPKNDFKRFIPLTRLQELRWRAELFGSDQVPGADFNDAQLGKLTGLRQIYREGLRKVNEVAVAMARKRFAKLPAAEQDRVFGLLGGAFRPDPRRGGTFVDLLIQHTLEGCFSAPEYGGNRRGRGWALIRLEGDTHPLGFSIFSRAKNGYNERPDHPMSTPNPDEVGPDGVLAPRPLNADGAKIQASIIGFAGILADDC